MTRVAVCTTLMLLVAASVASAQKDDPAKGAGESPRQGFFFTIGLGAGSVGIDCTGCNDERETGLSGTLQLGGTISPNVQLGIATNGWYRTEDVFGVTVTSTVGWLSVIAKFYPSRTGGFWFQVGAGLMVGRIDDTIDELTSTGAGGVLGLGYDFLVGRTVSLTPYLTTAASQGNLKFNGISLLDENFNPNLVQFGLALSVH